MASIPNVFSGLRPGEKRFEELLAMPGSDLYDSYFQFILGCTQSEETAMHVTEKGQVTIPKHIRVAAGVLPGSEVTFAIEAGNIVISKLASGIKTDRREQLRAAAAKVRQSMNPAFRQMPAADVMAFLRADEPAEPQAHGQP